MTRKGLLLLGFALAAALHLGVPASMIWSKERVLSEGEVFKFRTAPVDPYDAFRGRYVALAFQEHSAPLRSGQSFERGQEVYAIVEKAEDGFARFTRVETQAPAQGDYVRVRVTHVYPKHDVSFDLPFDRFYMNERLAPGAEKAYAELSRDEKSEACALVRVKDGQAAIEQVFVSGIPLADFAKLMGD